MPISFQDLKSLGTRVSLYTPQPSAPDQLVIICGWADGGRRAIARYIDLYTTIAPETRILLIQCSALDLVSPYAWQQASIKPAVQFLLDDGLLQRKHKSTGAAPKVLLHSFSNGGGLTATQLFILIREATNAPLPLVGIIMDSSPDGGTYRQTHLAVVVSKPRSMVQRAAVSLLGHAILLPIWASYLVGREENSQTVMRRVFLDREYVDTTSICYLYSKDDLVTNWTCVRMHAEEARKKGWVVDELEFFGSSHCAHISVDKERYAAAIVKMWTGLRRDSKI
ncbi:hypothetical protein PISL3812_03177 [Talaromyces islandicus]|uniref:Transmembrane protein 53 n=1 Tax=Talaromyces islandicus TaxID=28573 RepID=A0A0U1LS11_TALIS|nr:hypothetical protein PISL3812_03177 [Talaromyces islandicus]